MGDVKFNPINALTSLGSGLIGLYGAKKQRDFETEQAERQRAFSVSQTNSQNAWNYRMWQETNEYNSPSAQVDRMREAGLNPLFYGLDGSGASELTAAQPLGYDRASANAFTNPVQAGLDAAIKVAQISNIQADTAKKGEETTSEVKRREQMEQDIVNAKQELENMKAQKDLTDAQRADIEKRISWLDRINEANVARTESETALNESQKKRIDALLEGELNIQIKTLADFEKRWSKIEAEIRKMSKESNLLQKDIENYALNHASNGFMGTGLSFQNVIRLIKGQNIEDNPRLNSGSGSTNFSDSGSIADAVGNTD